MGYTTIEIVGLGSGDPEQLTLGAWRKLRTAARVFARTEHHPVMALLKEEGVDYTTFDDAYESHGSFPDVYEAIVAKLLQEALAPSEGTSAASVAEGHAAAGVVDEAKAGEAEKSVVGGASDARAGDEADGAVDDAVGDAVDGAVDGAVDDAVDGAVDSAVDDAVGGAVDSAVGGAVDSAVDDAVGGAAAGGERTLVYAVPGHPMVAERTVQLLRERCGEAGIELRISGGESFLDAAFSSLGIDPIEGFALLDATGLSPALLQPQLHLLIGQVYDAFTASDVKLALMERYPDDYEVVVGHALGVKGQERVVRLPLYELDRENGYGNLSLVYVPRSDNPALRNRTFERLHEIVAILRSPEGCPWDREQTHVSIRKNFIEELYEALEAIDNDDPDGMQEEFGDIILQVMLHSQMEEELGTFSVYDVIQTLNEKLIFRHPHVFGDRNAEDAEAALNNWEGMKAEEKRRKGTADKRTSQLDGIPPDLPALMKAYKLQKKAAKVGFDWDDIGPVLDKIEEELRELREAAAEGNKEKGADELGDLLFAVVNASRFIGTDPEEALSRTNRKFRSRFEYIEEQLRINGKTFDQTDLLEMDRWWEEAKRKSL